MKAKNIHKAPINLESGTCKPGGIAEFTLSEFKFLSGMGRACEYKEPAVELPKPPKPPKPPMAKTTIKPVAK